METNLFTTRIFTNPSNTKSLDLSNCLMDAARLLSESKDIVALPTAVQSEFQNPNAWEVTLSFMSSANQYSIEMPRRIEVKFYLVAEDLSELPHYMDTQIPVIPKGANYNELITLRLSWIIWNIYKCVSHRQLTNYFFAESRNFIKKSTGFERLLNVEISSY